MKTSGPGIEPHGLPAYKETNFTVDARNCGPVSPTVAKCYDKEGTIIPVKVLKKPDGVETFTYTPNNSGEHVVQVLVDNKEIPNSPFKVNLQICIKMCCKQYMSGTCGYGSSWRRSCPS